MPRSNNTTLDSALAIAARGQHVFPCKPRSKEPATPRGFLDATRRKGTITKWWRECPDYNLAIATGAQSNLFVLDIDSDDGESNLAKLSQQHSELPPPTTEVITSAGRHLYFRHPGQRVPCAVKILPGIDVRGDGGYVLCPPSTHPSGRTYTWSVDCAGSIADAPDWLVAFVTGRAEQAKPPTPDYIWSSIIADTIPDGSRNATLTKICGHLLRRYVSAGLTFEIIKIINTARCTPPLPAADIERICNSISGIELRRRNGNGN